MKRIIMLYDITESGGSWAPQFFMAGTYHFDITALVRKANVAGMFCHKSSGNLGELSCNVVIFTVKSAISSSKISGILENSWELVLSVHGVYI